MKVASGGMGEREERFARAEAALGEFYALRARGESTTFEAWREGYSAIAPELEQLYQACARFQSAMENPWEVPVPAQKERTRRLLERLAARPGNFGDYQIGDSIAKGGMGEIIAVRDSVLERDLAMKVIRGQESSRVEPDRLARFLEEARLTSKLDHPGIVPVHELGLAPDGRVYFTMKRVDGQDLSEVLELARSGKLGWSLTRVLGILAKVCEAVAFAHERGVIHRDLKPENIRVGKFGEVYVMDWGLAREFGQAPDEQADRETPGSPREVDPHGAAEATSGITGDGAVLGTPAYMAPEQALGKHAEVGPRSDIYAVGAMLYHLLAGHRPYADLGRLQAFQILMHARRGPPASLDRVAPKAPPELVAIAAMAMARDADARYPKMVELAGDLQAFLDNRVVKAHRTGAWAELGKWVGRNRGLAASIAGLFMALVAGFVTSMAFARQSRARADEVLRLSALPRLDYLIGEADELWPAHPASLPRLEAWMSRAEELLSDPVIRELAEVNSRQGEMSESSQNAWTTEQLRRFSTSFEVLTDPRTGLLSDGITPERGWSVRRRLDFASTIEQRSTTAPEAAARWKEAIASIRDRAGCPSYDGLVIPPQMGLVPIGQDPDSKLWEFAHLQTGLVPERDSAGHLVLTDETALVFVLIPGGSFLMGSNPEEGPNHDPSSQGDEVPCHEVKLSPFFLSKYEMTQGQWLRIAGRNPSYYNADLYPPSSNVRQAKHSMRLPVEQVGWEQCTRFLASLGLDLPSEAQWERAARGGTSTPWWTGMNPESLEGAANLADSFAQSRESSWICEDWSDGHFLHAPVGSFRPNPFGLHDVHGNVWEWCSDWFQAHFYETSAGLDPVCEDAGGASRSMRGGGFSDPSSMQRVSFRNNNVPEAKDSGTGLRPARSLVLD